MSKYPKGNIFCWSIYFCRKKSNVLAIFAVAPRMGGRGLKFLYCHLLAPSPGRPPHGGRGLKSRAAYWSCDKRLLSAIPSAVDDIGQMLLAHRHCFCLKRNENKRKGTQIVKFECWNVGASTQIRTADLILTNYRPACYSLLFYNIACLCFPL